MGDLIFFYYEDQTGCLRLFVSFAECLCLLLCVFLVTFPVQISENFALPLQRDAGGHCNCDAVLSKS